MITQIVADSVSIYILQTVRQLYLQTVNTYYSTVQYNSRGHSDKRKIKTFDIKEVNTDNNIKYSTVKVQCNIAYYSTVQSPSAVQYSTVWYSTIQHKPVQYSTVQ